MAKVTIDIDSLSFDETIIFEKVSELAIDEIGEPGTFKGGVMLAMAYIALRREADDPDSVSLEELRHKKPEEVLDMDDSDDPKESEPVEDN